MDEGQDTVSEQDPGAPAHAEVAAPDAGAGETDLNENDSGSDMDVGGGGRTPPMGSPRLAVQQQQQQQQTPKARVAAGAALTPGKAADHGQEVCILGPCESRAGSLLTSGCVDMQQCRVAVFLVRLVSLCDDVRLVSPHSVRSGVRQTDAGFALNIFAAACAGEDWQRQTCPCSMTMSPY